MSGTILPTITHVGFQPLYGSGGGSNVNSGNISSLYGYDTYTIYSSTFSDDSVTFQFANNYVEQQFLSDGSNYSRLTSGTDGLFLESYYLQASPFATGPRDVTLQTFDTTTGVVLSAGIDVATSSFFVSTTNGIISETGTMSNLNLSVLDLDGQIVTADPTDLLLNGVPIATSANISSLSEWAYDPAISTIQGNGQDLTGIRAGFFSSITANGIVAENLTVISTIQNFNYISTQQVNTEILSAQSLEVSSINATSLTATNFVSAAAIIASTFNGYTVSDFLSTSASQYDPNPLFSTVVININGFISTPDLEVSSINGHEFNQNTVIISTVNTDQLNAIQISSIVGDVQFQLVSTLQLQPNINASLGGVNLGLGNLLGNLGGWAAGAIGAVAGVAGLVTGAVALNQTRGAANIDNSRYEMVNGTSQLQVSTIPDFVSSIFRFNSSTDPERVPGEEIFISSIYPPGKFLRTMADPVYTISTPQSTIQAFGPWVPLNFSQADYISSLQVDELVVGDGPGIIRGDPAVSLLSGFYNMSSQTLNVDYINTYTAGANLSIGDPAATYIYFDVNPASGGLQIDSSPSGNSFMNADKIACDSFEAKNNTFISINANVERLVASNTNFLTSTVQIGPSTILTSENDFPGLAVRQVDDSSIAQVNASAFVVGDPDLIFEGAYTYAPTLDRAAVLNSSLVTKYVAYLDDLQNIQNNSVSTNTLEAGKATVSSLTFTGTSLVTLATAATVGAQSQPAGRLVMTGNDLDLGAGADLWCQQVRVGAGGAAAPAEIVFYGPPGNLATLNLETQDRTLRVGNSSAPGSIGYMLDTIVNRPFFSSINNQVNMMSYFPSTNSNTIGVSTISVIPNYLLSAYASTTQTVTAANTPTELNHNATTVNVGGFTVLASTITMPVSGIYEVSVSIQLDKDGGGVNIADFWFRKNGVDIPNSGSQTTVQGTNGEVLATVSIFEDIIANDKLAVVLASDDATMRAAFFQSTVTTPYTRPAIPAIITNIKKIG